MSKFLDCYIRVSTSAQKEDGNSLEVQEQLGRDMADRLGLTFRLRNEGARSSTIGFREELFNLQEDIKKKKVTHIWAIERSRLFRDMHDGLMFRRNYLEPYKINLIEGNDTSPVELINASNRFTYDIMVLVKQLENESRSEKSQQGKIHKLQHHSSDKPVFMGGSPLFGYVNEDKMWVIEPEESKWVKWIFNQYEKGTSVLEIKQVLDKEGIEPRRTGNGLWNLGTLRKMLQNKSYTGIHSQHIKKIDKTFSYKVPKIINVGQYNRVQNMLEFNQKVKDNNKKHFALLDGILKCECGTHIGSISKKGKTTSGYAINTRNYYCVSKNYSWRTGVKSSCLNKRSLQMDMTNEYVLNQVMGIVKKSSILKEKFKSDVLDAKFSKEKDIKAEEKKLENKVQRIQKTIEQVENNIVDLEVEVGLGKREKRIVDKIINRYTDELASLQDEYLKTEADIDNLHKELKWLDWVSKYGEKLELETSSEQKQKEFLEGVLEKIVVRSSYGKNRDGKEVQTGHKLDFHFKLKIVNDGITYTDKTTSPWQYKVSKGTKQVQSGEIKMSSARGTKPKKKQKKQLNNNENNTIHHSNTICNSGVVLSGENFSPKFTDYLVFVVTSQTNKLMSEYGHVGYSDAQQASHDIIKSLHNDGLGYRRIAQTLNQRGHKTPMGKEWKGNHVFAILKRNRERTDRLLKRDQTFEPVFSKFKVVSELNS